MATASVDLSLNFPQWQAYQNFKPHRTLTLAWGRGVGKALAIDTPVPTPAGWRSMGELAVGDSVFDETGRPCSIVATTEVMNGRECYSVEFDDGETIVADAEHTWLTWDHRARKSHGRAGPGRRPTCHPAVRTTVEIRESLLAKCGRERNHSVRVCSPLRYGADKKLPIHPYVLGAWLGDGTSTFGSITVGEQDAEQLEQELVRCGYRLLPRRCRESKPVAATRTIQTAEGKSIKPSLRELGVLGDKHIPRLYMESSVAQREELLAGLLDTDGHAGTNGRVEFTTTSSILAEQVLELTLSLGLKATLCEGTATINGRNCGPKFRINFATRRKLFRLARKNARIREHAQQINRATHRYIVAVKRIDSVPVKCIEVNSPSHLFLAGRAMVPTHNSYLLRTLLWLLVAQWDGKRRGTHKGVRLIVLMPTLKQFKDVYGADLVNDLEGPWAFLGGRIDRGTWQITFPGGSWIKPFPAAEHSSKSALGMRCDGIFLDEQDSIHSSVFDTVAVPWLSAPWSLGIVVGAGTPRRGRHGLHYRQYHYGELGARVRAGEELEGVTPETAEQLARHYSVFATYRDATETVRPEAVALAKATTAPTIFQREWEHNFDAAEGLVYGDVWDERFHVRQPDPETVWSEFFVGGDQGYEDPGVLLLCAKLGHGADAIVWVLDEIYRQHKTVDWWCEQLGAWVGEFGLRRVYYDPSQPSWKDSFRRGCGVYTPDVDNSIDAGVSAVANMLLPREVEHDDGTTTRSARLFIHPRCSNLIREINMYRRRSDPKDPDRYTDDIVDRDNHGPDSLRYAIAGHFGLPKTLGR